ncbi:unnamed protein product [Vitrella brassicaformis CCMP3155]|uniref:phenylalanine 4-monooxygenase n=1 Tax=Vitrella brassicaformis (strain CCMP3155) TaxID=1169540 RepID=A0A0G4H4S3_VITBC|nr:unnamed protein product [Vitrella brassicaformis CCMP3155]|eukprot:CEM38549.1 unnamed protein product [Vitrella brassicaformis CCMP3155]
MRLRLPSSLSAAITRRSNHRPIAPLPWPLIIGRQHRRFHTMDTHVLPLDSSDGSVLIRGGVSQRNVCGVSFTLEDSKGSLLHALRIFGESLMGGAHLTQGEGGRDNSLIACLSDKHNVNLTRIENRPSPLNTHEQMFYVHFEGQWDDGTVQSVVRELENSPEFIKGHVHRLRSSEVPWFPRRLADIDQFSKSTLDAGTDLDSDHPGFSDPEYRKRREQIVEQAAQYRSGQAIPRIDYSESEVGTWACVYDKLKTLFPDMACNEFNDALRELEAASIYSSSAIPQLQDVSDYLQRRTGFTLRPVTGLLSGRDFLNALAFRVFFSTQYIRHHSQPLYTPEPDVCHELMGHAPMLLNKDFADFSQIIGLASLGATDEDIRRLATCYWFSVEFGVLYQDGGIKAYGAGLLSSFGELQHATSPTNTKVEIRAWDPWVACRQEYPITTYQPIYFAATSLAEAKEKMLSFCESIKKPFCIRYDSEARCVVTDTAITPKPVSIKF